jgi:uncharacterized membrane protein
MGDDALTRIEKSIEIRVPPEKVWEMLALDRWPEWMDTMKKAEYTSEDKNVVGATAHAISGVAGVKDEYDAEITEWKENEKISWRSTSGKLKGMFSSMTLSPIKTGTKVTSVADYNLPYSILGKIIDKLQVSREVDKAMEKGLEKLKSILEK